MSFPTIPNINPTISINRAQVINLLLASVAFEELGLAHIINAEAEKIQAVIGTLPNVTLGPKSIGDLLSINHEVRRTLEVVLKTQMLLQFKLEDVLQAPDPAIDIEKLVSVDGGATFKDADIPPGPNLFFPTDPVFRLVVTNTGNVPLTGVSITDTVLGPISIGGSLATGQSFEQIITGTFGADQQTNTATVVGNYQGQIVQDSDAAFYFGVF